MARAQRDNGVILVADHDGKTRALVVRVLERAGYKTREAENGEDALDAAHRDVPRLVVLEVCLPGLSGYEVCHQLRNEFGDGLPIIFVSAERTEPFDCVAGLLIGADDYLVKPFAPDELLERTRALLRRARVLTSGELEVIRLLREGFGADEIGDRLGRAPDVVRHEIDEIFQKVGV